MEQRADSCRHDDKNSKQEKNLQKPHNSTQQRTLPADHQRVRLVNAGQLDQPQQQDPEKQEQRHRQQQSPKAVFAKAAEKLPQLLPGNISRAQKAAGISKAQPQRAFLFPQRSPPPISQTVP